MLSIEDQLFLIQSRGLPQEAAPPGAACEIFRERAAGPVTGGAEAARRRLIQRLEAEGLASRGPIDWPEPREVRALGARLRRTGTILAWRGREPYPARLAARLGEAAPPWGLARGTGRTAEPAGVRHDRLARERALVFGSGPAPGAGPGRGPAWPW